VADAPINTPKTEGVAENMLVAQRNEGGWAKTLDGKTQPPPYDKTWDEAQKAAINDDKGRNDATIDNNTTTREIRHLAKVFNETKNEKYKEAAERGIAYLLKMQYENGGFPQFFPDTSGYRKHITFNDNAMIKALEVLKDVAEAKKPFEQVGLNYREKSQKAVEKGIDCILKTQIISDGKLTIWCAQHHFKTLEPVKARSFELASFSGSESVGIIEFLMAIDNPTPSVKKAISSAVAFLDALKITGFKTERIKDASQTTGEDVIVKEDTNAVIWARFYDLDTKKPFFSGRDGLKKASLAEIENERRAHYAWYGTWPADLLNKKYPKWKAKWGE
jgi:PelA/Pel-15E family pectate lyase